MEMCKTLLGFAHFHRHRRHEPKQQNRTLHLLQKPDIFICYRHDTDTTRSLALPLWAEGESFSRRSRRMTHLCSRKVTHNENTIWRAPTTVLVCISIIHAEDVQVRK